MSFAEFCYMLGSCCMTALYSLDLAYGRSRRLDIVTVMTVTTCFTCFSGEHKLGWQAVVFFFLRHVMARTSFFFFASPRFWQVVAQSGISEAIWVLVWPDDEKVLLLAESEELMGFHSAGWMQWHPLLLIPDKVLRGTGLGPWGCTPASTSFTFSGQIVFYFFFLPDILGWFYGPLYINSCSSLSCVGDYIFHTSFLLQCGWWCPNCCQFKSIWEVPR